MKPAPQAAAQGRRHVGASAVVAAPVWHRRDMKSATTSVRRTGARAEGHLGFSHYLEAGAATGMVLLLSEAINQR